MSVNLKVIFASFAFTFEILEFKFLKKMSSIFRLNSFFNTFYITGGSSLLPGLSDFIANNLNVKVELLDPFKKINVK